MRFRSPDLRFPKGWYAVAESSEVKANALLPVTFLEQQFVVYRDAAGKAQVSSAFCPHLGAHLASLGGDVVNGEITCPFHKWSFDGANGRCLKIPYSKTMVSERVKLAIQPTVEVDDMVLMWFHPDGAEPDHQPLRHEDLRVDGPWLPCDFRVLTQTAPYRDILENLLDAAHIQFLHGTTGLPEAKRFERTPYGMKVDYQEIGVSESGSLAGERHAEGLSAHFCGVTQARYVLWSQVFAFLVMATITPIDRETTEMRVRVKVRETGSKENDEMIGAAFAQRLRHEVDQDAAIMNYKKHLVTPGLCQGDGLGIVKWRQYQQEFYT
jgi:3-ketosteroid 9alpha-monooxygenase subunit A